MTLLTWSGDIVSLLIHLWWPGGKDLAWEKTGAAHFHLSLHSLWHRTDSYFTLGTQWECLPFHSEAGSSPVTARTLFLLDTWPQQCLSYPSTFLSLRCLWLTVACSDLWIRLAPNNEVCYLQNRQTQQLRDKFLKLARCCDWNKLGNWEDLSWNKSQWVLQVYSEHGRVLEDAQIGVDHKRAFGEKTGWHLRPMTGYWS